VSFREKSEHHRAVETELVRLRYLGARGEDAVRFAERRYDLCEGGDALAERCQLGRLPGEARTAGRGDRYEGRPGSIVSVVERRANRPGELRPADKQVGEPGIGLVVGEWGAVQP
jgi:hypothetical protein